MNRILLFVLGAASVWAQSATLNDFPSREFGQLKLQPFATAPTSSAPNLVEGRELNNPLSIAFDTTASPPILYVADTFNNRVLAWINPAARNPGDPADKVIGQRDMFSTQFLGPGTSLQTGLSRPSAIAVNSKGDLYVIDAGNNRILRYPQPFKQTGDLLLVDLVIGQRSTGSGNQPNEGLANPNEKTLAFSQSGTLYTSRMAFDTGGALWVTDPLNNRVVRFPATVQAANTLEPAADVVLGQATFTSNAIPADPQGQEYWKNKNILEHPSGLAFDAQGRLYVTDQRARALFFPVLATGVPASRVLGVFADPQPGQRVTFPNAYVVGAFTANGGLIAPPDGVFTSGNTVFVVDVGDHRIMRFGPPETWLAETATVFSPLAIGVIGQADFTSGKPNHGAKEPDGAGFTLPSTAAFLGNDLWVVDTGNNRILGLPQNGQLTFAPATHLLGQFGYAYSSPNLVEGRELWVNSSSFTGGAVAVDKKSDPPHLYIADSLNNRILGFIDARKVGTDARTVLNQKADIVIGQPDLFHSTVNYPSADTLVLSDSGLFFPAGLAVDADGNLFVADTGNGRVLRFPAPFKQAKDSLQHANLVLGQVAFTAQPNKDAGISNLNAPFGLALLSNGNLAVSDFGHNRVVIFRRAAGGDFSNYQNAAIVLGQGDFSSSGAGNAVNQMRTPKHLAVDSSDRLYVMDTGNNRMMVFTNVNNSVNGATSAFTLPNLNSPFGIAVSQNTGEIWLANSNSNVIYRLPEFQTLQLNPNAQPTQIVANGPVALALDPFDNVVVVEGINRVTFYYAKGVSQHAASYNARPLAPGQLAYFYRLGKAFSFTTADGSGTAPWPTTLGDVQLSVNGTLAPIFHVLPDRIDFQVPYSTPSAGTADFVVQRASTGEILAAATFNMAPSNPGFFTANQAGTGQAIANNEDNTRNDPTNPASRGKVITFCLTGLGAVDGAPADGMPPTAATPTPVKPVVLSSAVGVVDPKYVLYSGLGCGFAGGWQLNFQIPEQVPPGNNNVIAVTYNDVSSNVGPTGTIQVVFATK